MDLSFTKDPNWISQRELQWKEIENIYREGSTRKEVMALKNYFMTGENPASLISVSSIIKLFPAFTVEGIQYCLNNYVSSSISDEQLERIQQVLANQDFVVGVTPEKKRVYSNLPLGKCMRSAGLFRS